MRYDFNEVNERRGDLILLGCDEYLQNPSEMNILQLLKIIRVKGAEQILLAAWLRSGIGMWTPSINFNLGNPFDTEINWEDFTALVRKGQSLIQEMYGERPEERAGEEWKRLHSKKYRAVIKKEKIGNLVLVQCDKLFNMSHANLEMDRLVIMKEAADGEMIIIASWEVPVPTLAYLKFVLDWPLRDGVDWESFTTLARQGQAILDTDALSQ